MASKLAYENEAFIQNVVTRHWQMEYMHFYNCWNEFQNAYTAQAFVFCDKPVDADLIVVAFRGTRPFDAARWCADVDPSWYKIPRLGRAHAAYTHALGAQRNIGWPKWVEHIKGKPQKVYAYYTIRDAVKELLEANKKARLLVTGHGSGGALAVLFPAILAYHKEKAVLDRLAGVYTFGQPRVGDAMLAMFVERNLDRPKKRHFRITYGDDPLPRLPNESSAVHFLHFGLGLHFDKSYRLKVLREIPGEATSSPLDFVRSRINSAWELGRSLHLGYRRGAYFREGWLLLLMRVLALALPGLPFHRVQDYVNAVVLGGYIPKDN
uniref:Fungal lipase-type domain-containing protein n=1 Tax=Arundo donax TaxID=35708 RepID=A0A0A9BK96_ARUDO